MHSIRRTTAAFIVGLFLIFNIPAISLVSRKIDAPRRSGTKFTETWIKGKEEGKKKKKKKGEKSTMEEESVVRK